LTFCGGGVAEGGGPRPWAINNKNEEQQKHPKFMITRPINPINWAAAVRAGH